MKDNPLLKLMKKISFVLALLLMPMMMFGDSYTSLWKKVSEAQAKDLPQTQINVLSQIIDKATWDKEYGHLLKAQLMKAAAQTQISPDSLDTEILRLEGEEQATGDQVLRSVYQAVLGTIYADRNDIDGKYKAMSKKWFEKAMEKPELLAQHKCAEYKPAMVEGIDSKVFNDDLLHVIGIMAGDYKTMYHYYVGKGYRAAACMSAIQWLRQNCSDNCRMAKKSRYLLQVDSLMQTYGDLPEAGELAIARYQYLSTATDVSAEDRVNYINYALAHWGAWPRINILRNALSDLQQPSFTISVGDYMLLPDKPRKLYINAIRNITTLNINVYRLNLDGSTRLDPSVKDDYARLQRVMAPAPVQTITKRYLGMPAWKETGDSAFIDPLPVGVYLIEASTDNSNIEPRRALLRVSNLYIMYETLPDSHLRVAVVNATTGQAVPGANVKLTSVNYQDRDKRTTTQLVTDKNGEVDYKFQRNAPQFVYAYTQDDKSCGEFETVNAYYNYWEPRQQSEKLHLFTDRSLYRPGQVVHAAAILFHADNEQTKSKPLDNQSVVLVLNDANGKTVAQQTLTTDGFGKVSADFTLPQNGLTGNFMLLAKYKGAYAYASLNVEQYNRPTFQVEFDKYDKTFQIGDTVQLRGVAKSYAGVPVRGAKVALTVERRQSLWWRWNANAEPTVVLIDSVQTGDDGSFVAKVPMLYPENVDIDRPFYYAMHVNALVTDIAGESHEASTSLPLSNRASVLTSDLPSRSLRDDLKTLRFTRQNAGGEPIDGMVSYRFDQEEWKTAKANQSIELDKKLASGLHRLEAICEQDTLRQEVVVFNLNDKKPAVETNDWYYLSAQRFSDSKPVYLQYGTSAEGTQVYYAIFAGNKVIERGTKNLDNEVVTRKLQYKKEYGDGITITMAWVRNGKLYSHTSQIARPLPDQQLKLEWKTFRNMLTPGQKEEWTLSILDPQGKPAHAQLLATMYDKSLDAILPHKWSFNNGYYDALAFTQWNGGSNEALSLYGFQNYRNLTERELDFAHFDPSMFTFASPVVFYTRARVMKSEAVGAVADVNIRGAHKMVLTEMNAALEAQDQTQDSNDAAQPIQANQVRENLNETAFFFPALTTDKDGNVAIRFTLPESVTTWRFMGVAHDLQVNYGLIEAEATARKTVMVQPNLPRFMRMGDKAQVNTRIHNTSDKRVCGTARLQLLTPDAETVVGEWTKTFVANPDQSVNVSFDVDADQVAAHAKGENLLVARILAEGKGYSDGEQHYLALLPNQEYVTATVPFTQNGPGVKTIDISRLFPTTHAGNKLTVEYTNNPAWLMIQALPTLASPNDRNAVSLASAIYANSIGRSIIKSSPLIAQTLKAWQQETGTETSLMSNLNKDEELKTMVLSETPWVAEADNETDQKGKLIGFLDESTIDYRLNTFTSKIRDLQNTDGSFSWWPGMPGSSYMTISVVKMFTRLNSMLGTQAETADLLSRAFAYLDRTIADEVKELKKLEKKGTKHLTPSELACNYLYANALAGRKATSDINYLVGLLEEKPSELTIYGKAGSAVILAQYGKQKKAEEYLQSIIEYTVYKEEVGRYFDTKRAAYSWFDYRIPTQVAAIEALKALKPGDKQTIEEMQRWLLQEKRTQAWDTPLNATDAVFAFLADAQGMADLSKLAGQAPATLKIDGKALELPKATAGIGYVKTLAPSTKGSTFTAEKTGTGTSWGALYAQFWQKATDVEDASAGLSVKREIVTSKGPADGNTLKVGSKVKVRITITADRDYDFVQVQDKRAACLEPVGQLSGYRGGYYCAPQNNATNYYFDRLAKGKHIIETDYYIDREGEYTSGICTAQCAYSPSFSAREAAKTLKVNP